MHRPMYIDILLKRQIYYVIIFNLVNVNNTVKKYVVNT